MAQLQVVQHPDKTFIGRIVRGFDFLGYWFSPSGMEVASKTVSRMLDKVSRLYEQGADDNRVEEYVQRWWRWVQSGVGGVVVGLGLLGVVGLCVRWRYVGVVGIDFYVRLRLLILQWNAGSA